jgi:hypothetical protein
MVRPRRGGSLDLHGQRYFPLQLIAVVFGGPWLFAPKRPSVAERRVQ